MKKDPMQGQNMITKEELFRAMNYLPDDLLLRSEMAEEESGGKVIGAVGAIDAAESGVKAEEGSRIGGTTGKVEEGSRLGGTAGRPGRQRVSRRRIPLMVLGSAASGVAAGILIMLLVRPLLTGRVSSSQAESVTASNSEAVYMAEAEAAEETSDAKAAEEASDAAVPAGGAIMEDAAAAQEAPAEIAETEEAAVPDSMSAKSESAAASAAETASEAAADTSRTANTGTTAAEQDPEAGEDAAPASAGQDAAPAEQADAEQDESVPGTGAEDGKTSADLLGDFKGDYVKVEYISAKDMEEGKDLTELPYSVEGEQALGRAVREGTPEISLFETTEVPLYYVYLTKENGDIDEMIVYEGGYVTLSSKPGVRLKIPKDVFEEVEVFFGEGEPETTEPAGTGTDADPAAGTGADVNSPAAGTGTDVDSPAADGTKAQ